MERHFYPGAGCTLSAVETGSAAGPPMVILHGMRDHGQSMQRIAAAFPGHRVILPDLRGHGQSDNPGGYALVQMVADLCATVDRFGLDRFVLVGHSLGGHIASQFAASFPDAVGALVLIDGMGPPRSGPRAVGIERFREAVMLLADNRDYTRLMKDEAEAVARLVANNPKLDPGFARFIVHEGLRPMGEGVTWLWDPRVQSIWSTFSHEDSEARMAEIRCPVLVVTGEHSPAYWQRSGLNTDVDAGLYERENTRRLALFPDARHVVIAGAGHMIHYDEPDALNRELIAFLAATHA